jgi:anti-sigma B factor antagonist
MMDLPDIRFELVEGTRIARVAGEVDTSNAWSVSRTIREVMSNEDRRLVLDLSGVSYLDSAGVRMLFELRRILHQHGQELVLVVPEGAPIRRTLDVSAVLGTIPVVESPDAARS